MKRSPDCLRASLEAQTRLLDGGVVSILDVTGRVLANVALPTPAFSVGVDGTASARGEGVAMAIATGRPAIFEARTSGGGWVISGTAGARDAECIIGSETLTKGDEVVLKRLVWTANG